MLSAIGRKMLRSVKIPLTKYLPLVIPTVIQQVTRIWWLWKRWKGALMEGLIKKWVMLLTLLKTGFGMLFLPRLILILPEIELAIRPINASYRRDETSVMAISECGEHLGITAFSENVSEGNDTLHVFNMNDETRKDIPDEVSELSVPRTHYDQQPHTYHRQSHRKQEILKQVR